MAGRQQNSFLQLWVQAALEPEPLKQALHILLPLPQCQRMPASVPSTVPQLPSRIGVGGGTCATMPTPPVQGLMSFLLSFCPVYAFFLCPMRHFIMNVVPIKLSEGCQNLIPADPALNCLDANMSGVCLHPAWMDCSHGCFPSLS